MHADPEREKTQAAILIVDDDAVNRAILEQIFSGRYRVLEAENGVLRWKLVNDMSHLPEELRRAPMQYTFHTEAL